MDILELDRRSLAVITRLLADATVADLERQTPCAAWDLGELLRHQISENHGFALAARHGSAANWDSGVLGDDPFGAYAESVEVFLAAFAGEDVLSRQMTIREFGTFPGEIAAHMHLVDSIAHGWDIATTLGLEYKPDAEALTVAVRFAELIPAAPADRATGASFAPVVPAPAGASTLDRFLSLLGRNPDRRAFPQVRAESTFAG